MGDDIEEANTNSFPRKRTVQRQGSHFDVENLDDDVLMGRVDNDTLATTSPCPPGEIFHTELHRPDKRIGFGFNIGGGSDRPFLDIDTGIFVTDVKSGSAADKEGRIEAGDKILEINGHSVIYERHDDVVNMFKACDKSVNLTLQKSAGLILRSAALTEESLESGRSSPSQPLNKQNRQIKDGPLFSLTGFVVGIAVGCVAVMAARKILLSKSS